MYIQGDSTKLPSSFLIDVMPLFQQTHFQNILWMSKHTFQCNHFHFSRFVYATRRKVRDRKYSYGVWTGRQLKTIRFNGMKPRRNVHGYEHDDRKWSMVVFWNLIHSKDFRGTNTRKRTIKHVLRTILRPKIFS